MIAATSSEKPKNTFKLTVELVFHAESIEAAQPAVEKHINAVLPSALFKIDPTEEASDGRFLVIDGMFGREPLSVKKVEDLRMLTAKHGEVARIEGQPAPYVYNKEMPSTTVGLDMRYTSSSMHGGVWLRIDYYQHLEQQKMQAAQAGAMAARPAGR